jgi:hypothetical protein
VLSDEADFASTAGAALNGEREGVVVAVDAAAPPKENPDVAGAVVFAAPNNGVLVVGLEAAPKGEEAVPVVLRPDAVEPNGELDAFGTVKLLPKVVAEAAPVDAFPKSGVVVVVEAVVAPNNELDAGVAVVEADAPNNGALVVVVDCVEPKGDEAVLAPPNNGVEVAG